VTCPHGCKETDPCSIEVANKDAEIKRLREAICNIVREAEAVEFEPEGVCHFRVLTCRWDALEEIAREGR